MQICKSFKQNLRPKKNIQQAFEDDKIRNFKQFLMDVDYLKKVPLKLKGLDAKTVESLQVSKYKPQQFVQYYHTFLTKFAEKCQKKWSKKDKAMLLWIIVRFIQKINKKSIEELSQDDYSVLADIVGIKKQVLIQQVSQIICLKTSKHPFSQEEKNLLLSLIRQYDGKSIQWNVIAQTFNNSFQSYNNLRTIKSLKQVYNNHLNPCLSKEAWKPEEDIILISQIEKYGKKWQKAANSLKTRNQCQVKNEYYKLLREQMQQAKLPMNKKLPLEIELQLLVKYKNQLIEYNGINPSLSSSSENKISLVQNNFHQVVVKQEERYSENDVIDNNNNQEEQIECSYKDYMQQYQNYNHNNLIQGHINNQNYSNNDYSVSQSSIEYPNHNQQFDDIMSEQDPYEEGKQEPNNYALQQSNGGINDYQNIKYEFQDNSDNQSQNNPNNYNQFQNNPQEPQNQSNIIKVKQEHCNSNSEIKYEYSSESQQQKQIDNYIEQLENDRFVQQNDKDSLSNFDEFMQYYSENEDNQNIKENSSSYSSSEYNYDFQYPIIYNNNQQQQQQQIQQGVPLQQIQQQQIPQPQQYQSISLNQSNQQQSIYGWKNNQQQQLNEEEDIFF